MRSVRIGAAQAFYGDSLRPALELARKGNVNYLCFDCLAELTMAILQKDRQKDPNLGYTRDVVPAMKALLPICLPRGIKLITNAGGINPAGAARAVAEVARGLGVNPRIAVVTGDDVLPRLGELDAAGIEVKVDKTGRLLGEERERLLFATAYLGADPIVAALRAGADLVITGRTTDTAQYLAACAHEFGWAPEDWDRRAQAIVLGHIMECTAQATGGNFSGRWWEVDLENIGFPVAEVYEDGSFIVTKPEGTGGLVSVDTVKEQFLYEVHDPATYISPDVIVDFTAVHMEDAGPDRVRVWGAVGRPAPPTLKVIMGFSDGWIGEGRLVYTWPDALPKARKAEELLRGRLEAARVRAEEIRVEYLGLSAVHEGLAAPPPGEPAEVTIRLAVRTREASDAAKVGREFPPLVLAGPPHATGFGGIQPVREVIEMASCLVPRELMERAVQVRIEEV